MASFQETTNNVPKLHFKKMWHFGLDAKVVVVNDIAMESDPTLEGRAPTS